jgi:hypothetical protein
MATAYIGAFQRPDGFNGDTCVVHLVKDCDGPILAVHPSGYHVQACGCGRDASVMLDAKPACVPCVSGFARFASAMRAV